MYSLFQQLNKEDYTTLWFWILGVTDQVLSYKINEKDYEKITEVIQKETLRLNISNFEQSRFFSDENNANNQKFASQSTFIKRFGSISIERKCFKKLKPFLTEVLEFLRKYDVFSLYDSEAEDVARKWQARA